MEQNNFEKQVQQKMEELNFSPSESSWNNIEKKIIQIRDRKKVIFLLWIFISLLVFTGFYWFYNSVKINKYENKNESIALLKNQIQKRDSFVEKPVLVNKNSTKSEKRFPKKYEEVKPEILNSQKINNQHQQKIKEQAVSTTQLTKDDVQQEELNKPDVGKEKKIKKSEKSFLADDASDSVVKVNSDDEINKNNIAIEPSAIKKDDQNVEGKSQIKNELKEDLSTVNPSEISNAKKQKSNWESGFAFSGGTSFAGQGLFSEDKSALNYSSPVTSGGIPTYNYRPSASKNSFAFSAGVFVQKNILRESKISVGINYKYFSTKIKVGNKMDSLRSNNYSTNPLNDFHNRFHFIELPVTLKLRINPGKSLPVYWKAGVSISQMINTNALQFKTNPAIYYADNSLFNKTRVGFNTGFSATLFSKNKNPISVGPYFYYDATRLGNKGLYNKTHFSFIGISAEILLNKK